MRGEKIYECDFVMTGVTDYGVSMDNISAVVVGLPIQELFRRRIYLYLISR
jgi:hypothetical protein